MDPSVVRRLAEAAAWASLKLPAADLGAALRSADLHPPEFPEWDGQEHRGGLIEKLLDSSALVKSAVDFIARERRSALSRLGLEFPAMNPPLDGRILCTDFNSDLCGAATPVSNGFFDWEDVPAWDTWFHHEDTGEHGGIVACWIPKSLVELVDRGAYVIPVTSAWWDDDPPRGAKTLFPRWRT